MHTHTQLRHRGQRLTGEKRTPPRHAPRVHTLSLTYSYTHQHERTVATTQRTQYVSIMSTNHTTLVTHRHTSSTRGKRRARQIRAPTGGAHPAPTHSTHRPSQVPSYEGAPRPSVYLALALASLALEAPLPAAFLSISIISTLPFFSAMLCARLPLTSCMVTSAP
jgi:hypothetical protein